MLEQRGSMVENQVPASIHPISGIKENVDLPEGPMQTIPKSGNTNSNNAALSGGKISISGFRRWSV